MSWNTVHTHVPDVIVILSQLYKTQGSLIFREAFKSTLQLLDIFLTTALISAFYKSLSTSRFAESAILSSTSQTFTFNSYTSGSGLPHPSLPVFARLFPNYLRKDNVKQQVRHLYFNLELSLFPKSKLKVHSSFHLYQPSKWKLQLPPII